MKITVTTSIEGQQYELVSTQPNRAELHQVANAINQAVSMGLNTALSEQKRLDSINVAIEY